MKDKKEIAYVGLDASKAQVNANGVKLRLG